MKKHLMEIRNVNKSFFGNRVLQDISMHVDMGEVVCIAGENGSGKSTIIKIVSGVYEADSGSVSFKDNEYDRLSPAQAIKEGVQVIYQDFSVFPNLTVAENIGLSSHLLQGRRTINWKQYRHISEQALSDLGVELDIDKKVEQLSVAQKQIVAICRALLHNARLIIMDEPTTTLSYKEILRLYEIIDRLKLRNISIIFVSHKLDEVFKVSDRIIVIRNGQKVVDKDVSDFDKSKLSLYMTGSDIREENILYRKHEGEPAFEVSGLTSKNAFSDISFSVMPGEIFGITGQLGSGRTELAKALFGMRSTEYGSISIRGKKIELSDIQSALDNGIVYIPEDRLSEGLFLELPIKHNISAAVLNRMKNRIGLIDKSAIDSEASGWINRLSISTASSEYEANSLSGGNQQRVVLAKWLARNPEVLILNCPTVGVDIKSKSEIHELIKKLADNGIIIILISDDIGEILSNVNRLIIMKKGRVSYKYENLNLSYDELSSRITED